MSGIRYLTISNLPGPIAPPSPDPALRMWSAEGDAARLLPAALPGRLQLWLAARAGARLLFAAIDLFDDTRLSRQAKREQDGCPRTNAQYQDSPM